MILRCKRCHNAVTLDTASSAGPDQIAKCKKCGQCYRYDSRGREGAVAKLGDTARRLAREQSLDLPAAYSVVLGVMSLDEARDLGGSQSPPEVVCDREYDPAFEPAVKAGTLSCRQAVERGHRESYANRVATRHGLALELARDVADNRITLLEAKRRSNPGDAEVVRLRLGPDRQRWPFAAGAALVVLTIGFFVLRSPAESSPTAGRSGTPGLGAAELHRGLGGEVEQISGPDPATILRAYCKAVVELGCLDPTDVLSTKSRGARARLGVFRTASDPETILSILIVEDREGSRWVAGTPGRPLTPDPAPAGATLARHPPSRQSEEPRQGESPVVEVQNRH